MREIYKEMETEAVADRRIKCIQHRNLSLDGLGIAEALMAVVQ